MIDYKFIGKRIVASTGVADTPHTLRAVYGEKCGIKYAMNDGTRYYKPSWDGTIRLIGDDYAWVMEGAGTATRFGTRYEIDVKWRQDLGAWQQLITLQFVLTDCEIDADSETVTVKPSVKTPYQDVEDGLSREFNLVKLNPAMQPIYCRARPYIQLYYPGSDTVTNIQGSQSWDVEATATTGINIVNTYKFTLAYALRVFQITSPSTDIADAKGTYLGEVYEARQDTYWFDSNDTPYRLKLTCLGSGISYYYRLILQDRENTAMAWYDYPTGVTQSLAWQEVTNSETAITLRHGTGVSPIQCTVAYNTQRLYSRVLCNSDDIGGVATVNRPTSDICTYSPHYTKILQISLHDYLSHSVNVSLTPTEWGRVYEDAWRLWYWNVPDTTSTWMPVQRPTWLVDYDANLSWWMQYVSIFDAAMLQSSAFNVLPDTYSLASAIKALLAEVAPSVTFDATTAYSEFLFAATNPVLNATNFDLYITAKSNFLKGRYDIAAQNAPVTLRHILDFLRNALKCYWYIDSTNKLRIEHVSWFMNGGAYGASAHVIGHDLTAMRNTRNGKAWSFGKDAWSYGKTEMPRTYTFAWMDEVSETFRGYQMTMLSPLVDKEKNEEAAVDKFTSDISYVMSTPDDISKDGFMVFACRYNSSLGAPLVADVLVNGKEWACNGLLSFAYLEKTDVIKCDIADGGIEYADGTTGSTTMQSRNMEQKNVIVPLQTPQMEPVQLIRTGLGDGEVKEATINLSSLTANATLRYDTVQQ